jgi:hypothetical protein
MPLQQQLLQIDFSGGQETWEDERLVVPGKWLQLTNATLSKSGLPVRRTGTSQLAASQGDGGVAEFNSELLSINGGTLYSLQSSNSTFVSKGSVSNASVTKQETVRTTASQFFPSIALSGNTYCLAWVDAGPSGTGLNSISCQLIDVTTGNIVYGPVQLHSSVGNCCAPRVCQSDRSDEFLIFYADGATNTLYGRVVSKGTINTEVTLATSVTNMVGAGPNLAWDPISQSAVVAYISTDATNSVFALRAVRVGVSIGTVGPTACFTQANLPNAQISSVVVGGGSGITFGVYAIGSLDATHQDVWGITLTVSSMAVSVAASKLDSVNIGSTGSTGAIAAVGVAGGLTLFYDYLGASTLNATSSFGIRTLTVDSSNNITSSPATYITSAQTQNTLAGGAGLNGPYIAGQPINVSGSVMLPVYFFSLASGGGLQNSWFLLNSGVVFSKALYGTAGSNARAGFAPNKGVCPPSPVVVPNSSPAAYVYPMMERNTLSLFNGTNVSQTGICLLSLTPSVAILSGGIPPAKSKLSNNLFLTKGLLNAYDGQSVTEAGFHLFPEAISVGTGAAGSIAAGTYSYVALYEWIDGQGNRHQSAASPAFKYTAPGAKQATVTIPTLLLSQKSNVNVVVYRTDNNGSTYYRLNDVNNALPNSTSVSYVTLTDNSVSNSSNEILAYQGGALLPNNGPPPCTTCSVHQGRLWLDVSDDPYAFRYSQAAISGVGLQFNETLQFRLPLVSGGYVASVSMDDKLIVFGKRKIYVIFGQGPSPGGAGSTYSSPIEIPSDVGASDARTPTLIPQGIIFSTTKGWYLLTRALEVRYIGSGVEAYNGSPFYCGVVHQTNREVRFGGFTGQVGTLVFDYVREQWSRFDYVGLDAIWSELKGTYVFCDGTNLQQETGVTDNGSVVVVTGVTAWIKLNTLGGFQRARRAFIEGAYNGNSTLVLSYGVDYDSALTSLGGQATTNLKTASSNAWLGRWHLPVQKCSAIRFSIVDTPAASSSGVGFSSMQLEVGVKKGGAKLPAGKSF